MIIDNPTISGSALLSGSLTITGSLNVSGSISGLASNAVSASYALNATSASYALNATTASYALIATSASYALASTSASYSNNATSASYSNDATSASYALNATSASQSNNANTATSASYAANSDLLDGRDSLTFANTGSNSFVGTQNINGAVAITGSLTTTGAITAQTLNVQQVTSSIVYSSGSNIFGNSVSNTQSMTGSVGISGSLAVVGAGTFSGRVTTGGGNINGIVIPANGSALTIPTTGLNFQTGYNVSYIGSYNTSEVLADLYYNASNHLFNNNVGIGASTAPAYMLEVSSTGGSQRIRVGTLQNNSNTPKFEAITSAGTSVANSAWLKVGNGGGFTLGQSSYTKTGGDSGNFANLSSESESTYITVASGGAATFSSSVTLKTTEAAEGLIILGRSDDFGVLRFKNASGSANKATIYTNPNSLVFDVGAASSALTIASTGAATFSSSVTLSGTNSQLLQTTANSIAGDNAAVFYNSNANSYGLYIGAGSGTNHALYITDSTRTKDLFKVQGDGNVGIGTTTISTNSLVRELVIGQNITNGVSKLSLRSDTTSQTAEIALSSYLGENLMAISTLSNSPMLFLTNNTERMRITSAGAVTRPFQPFAMGALASNQSISLSTFTTLAFQTNQGFYGVNTGSCWNNSTYTFTAPVTGVYMVNLSVQTDSIGQVALFVNGVRKHSIPSWYVSGSIVWGGSALIPLTAGEALTLQGYGNAGTVTANNYHTWFAIYLL
jgi:hypothetical protein